MNTYTIHKKVKHFCESARILIIINKIFFCISKGWKSPLTFLEVETLQLSWCALIVISRSSSRRLCISGSTQQNRECNDVHSAGKHSVLLIISGYLPSVKGRKCRGNHSSPSAVCVYLHSTSDGAVLRQWRRLVF